MMIFKKSIHRRTFLRGAGAALALPFLDAMIPALASTGAGKPPLRIGYIYLPTGRLMDRWVPKTTGAAYELPPTLQPLAAFREQFVVLSGLDIVNGRGTHAPPAAAYLTGLAPSKLDHSVGISADQVIAKQIGEQTMLASLELGVDPPEWAFARVGGLAGYYTSTISWRTPTTPLPRQTNPRMVFERLFGDTDSLDPVAMRQRLEKKTSVLDEVNGRVKNLMSSVNANDRHKLEEYLDSVREIERSIEVAESKTNREDLAVPNMERPSGIPTLYADHVRLMFDMMVLAYQTDMTRMISFMLGHEGSNRNYLELGAKDGHHALSHHKGKVESIEFLKKIELHQSEQLAYFFGKMQSIKEGDGTLLDNSLIVTGGAHSDSNMHLSVDLPTLVVGSAQGKIKGGRHIKYNHVPISNLHLKIMDIANVSAEEFLNDETDATGLLDGLDTVRSV
jgi:hypothetical protein